jgi:hypothetical protein
MEYNNQSPALLRMTVLVSQWEQDKDRRAIFLQCYSMMTRNMLDALVVGRFHDRDWVGELLNHFAGYYFKSLEVLKTLNSSQRPCGSMLTQLL